MYKTVVDDDAGFEGYKEVAVAELHFHQALRAYFLSYRQGSHQHEVLDCPICYGNERVCLHLDPKTLGFVS